MHPYVVAVTSCLDTLRDPPHALEIALDVFIDYDIVIVYDERLCSQFTYV